jgi:hypothetical protein
MCMVWVLAIVAILVAAGGVSQAQEAKHSYAVRVWAKGNHRTLARQRGAE